MGREGGLVWVSVDSIMVAQSAAPVENNYTLHTAQECLQSKQTECSHAFPEFWGDP